MTGLVLIAKGADFSDASVGHVGLRTSVASGLVLLHETRRSASKATNNSAPGGARASILGSPAFSPGYASVSAANRVIMGSAPTGQSTIACVLRTKSGGVAGDLAAGSFSGTALTTGAAYIYSFNYRLGMQAISYPAGATPPLSGGTTLGAYVDMPTSPRFEMAVVALESGVSARIRVPRTGQAGSASAVGRDFAFNGATPWSVGLSGTATHDVALFAVWNRVLSQAEQDTFYSEMIPQLARSGVVI